MNPPYLLFEFRNQAGKLEPMIFTNPVKILQTNKIGEVAGILEQLDEAAEAGYYSAGFVSYEAAPAFDPAMETAEPSDFPLVWFGIFTGPQKAEPGKGLGSSVDGDYKVSGWKLTGTPEAYQNGIQRIKEAIEEGDTYQVNYTERMHADFAGDDFAFYRQLARNQQAGYSAYLNIGNHRILSASPELFFRVQDGRLTTKPMKGTAARGRTLGEDKMRVAELSASTKEQAENLMIVDLLRNDMSRLAKKGTVKVEKLFDVETYPTVHQMTSTIKAELAPDLKMLDWFRALFPCGSITGAPKISTMQTIAKLEGSSRDVYCGAVGFMTPDKNAVFNVPIRTVIIDKAKGKARYGVGGGVTWDSTSAGEFQELYTKAEVLTARRPEFELLESLKLEDGKYPLLNYHIDRLLDSAAYFGFRANGQEILKRLHSQADELPEGLYKVRLLLGPAGNLTIEAQKTAAIIEPVRCALAASLVHSENSFLYHKTTYRQVYEQAAEKSPAAAFSTLLWNEREELTEFTIGNLIMEKDGEYYTPPLSSGLLPGTFRRQLLDAREIKEKVIRKKDLNKYDAIWFVNSVRGWLKVEMIE